MQRVKETLQYVFTSTEAEYDIWQAPQNQLEIHPRCLYQFILLI